MKWKHGCLPGLPWPSNGLWHLNQSTNCIGDLDAPYRPWLVKRSYVPFGRASSRIEIVRLAPTKRGYNATFLGVPAFLPGQTLSRHP